MGKFLKALKAGVHAAVKATVTHTGRFSAGGTEVICLHCGNDIFSRRHIAVHPASFISGDSHWNDRSVTTLICERCSHIEWFARSPDLKQ